METIREIDISEIDAKSKGINKEITMMKSAIE